MLLQCASKLVGGFLLVGDYLALITVYWEGENFSLVFFGVLFGRGYCMFGYFVSGGQYFCSVSAFRGVEIRASQQVKSSA